MEETVTIISIEQKQTKARVNMWTVVTNYGKMSVFDQLLADKLATLKGQNVLVEVQEKNGYKNIVKFISVSAIPVQNIPQAQPNSRNVSASMMIAYAKDLCVAGKIGVEDIGSQAKSLLQLYEEMLETQFS